MPCSSAVFLNWGSILFPGTLGNIWRHFYFYILFYLFFLFFGHTAKHVGSQFPDQGWNPRPLHWKHGVLTNGLPGKSLETFLVVTVGGSYWHLVGRGHRQYPRAKDYLAPNVNNVKVKNSSFNEKELFLHRVEFKYIAKSIQLKLII